MNNKLLEMTTHNRGTEVRREQQQLPLLLRNLKKAFKDAVTGPFFQGENQYQANIEYKRIKAVAKFLAVRGIKKLMAINYWENKEGLNLSYHFVSFIGLSPTETKLTIVLNVPNDVKSVNSIKEHFLIAKVFEEEISNKLNLLFE